jgi:hypothetical protein
MGDMGMPGPEGPMGPQGPAPDLSGYATTTDVTNLQFSVINNQIQSDNLLAQTQYLNNEIYDLESSLYAEVIRATTAEEALDSKIYFRDATDFPGSIYSSNPGNVGIGTDLPSEKLDVAGNLKVRENAMIQGTATANSFVKDGGTSTQFLMADGSVSTGGASGFNAFETTADDATAIHNTNSGNVGIGTDLPSEKLDVAGNLRVRGNVGIGTETPNTSAALEINSTTGSLLIPRMTTAERNNLTAAEGMIIYNTSTSSYQGISKIVTNAAPVVDQSNLTSQFDFTTSDVVQSFKAGLSGALTGVRLQYSVDSDTSGTIYIRDGAGNSGQILGQTAINNTASGMEIRDINISGVNLIAGHFYSINLVAGGIGVAVAEDLVGVPGSLFINGIEFNDIDCYFSTTVTPPPTSSLQWENFSNGSTTVPGATGPAGPAGPQGLPGPAGSSSFATSEADATAIYNTNDGNVGIGTDNPSAKLDVAGDTKVSGSITSMSSQYGLQHGDGNVLISTFMEPNAGQFGTVSNHSLEFFTNNSGALVSLTTAGDFGIGTTDPSEKLDVAGNVKVSGMLTTNSLNVDSGTSEGATLQVNGAATNTTAFNAEGSLTIDFTKSNLAYTTASASAFTLSGMKDGGTYTLAVQGATAGTASFSQTGFTFKSISNGATTASKHTIYTFLVLGDVVYFSMATGF